VKVLLYEAPKSQQKPPLLYPEQYSKHNEPFFPLATTTTYISDSYLTLHWFSTKNTKDFQNFTPLPAGELHNSSTHSTILDKPHPVKCLEWCRTYFLAVLLCAGYSHKLCPSACPTGKNHTGLTHWHTQPPVRRPGSLGPLIHSRLWDGIQRPTQHHSTTGVWIEVNKN